MHALSAAPLTSFLARLADGAPTPGGGAAAALAAATAAALVGMVCRVTARRAPSSRLDEIAREADGCRERAVAMIDADARAYGDVVGARRAERSGAPSALAGAMLGATQVPLDIARVGHEILKLGEALAPSAAPSTISDLLVAVALAHASVESAVTTAKTNLGELETSAATEAMNEAAARLPGDAALLRRHIHDTVERRR